MKIAIDDFGTGFSSLSYLQRLQIDRLKVDRAFVTEITASTRGSSIAEMVIQLDLSVVAKRIENERQVQILQALGCPMAQDFLFARPVSPPARAAAGRRRLSAAGLPAISDQSSCTASSGQSRMYALSMRFSKLCASSTARATS